MEAAPELSGTLKEKNKTHKEEQQETQEKARKDSSPGSQERTFSRTETARKPPIYRGMSMRKSPMSPTHPGNRLWIGQAAARGRPVGAAAAGGREPGSKRLSRAWLRGDAKVSHTERGGGRVRGQSTKAFSHPQVLCVPPQTLLAAGMPRGTSCPQEVYGPPRGRFLLSSLSRGPGGRFWRGGTGTAESGRDRVAGRTARCGSAGGDGAPAAGEVAAARCLSTGSRCLGVFGGFWAAAIPTAANSKELTGAAEGRAGQTLRVAQAQGAPEAERGKGTREYSEERG